MTAEKGQFKFNFNSTTGDIYEPQVVGSKAHEHGPKEKLADLLEHADEIEQLRAWTNEGGII